ncbi:CaiB/BaiF CoA transferase family protein [Rhodococcus sp. C26F]
MAVSSGPLAGLKVLEIAGLGPTPHAAMILADLGADVVRVDRPAEVRGLTFGGPGDVDVSLRGRRSLALNLKSDPDRDELLRVVEHADVLLEGLRPGVMERLGVGPDVCLARNPRLVYGRMTGWGQTGPRASLPGHDINYIAVTGALNAMGPRDAVPMPPLNLVGDFGGGSMLLLLGVLAALYERQVSHAGQVVDAAMVDGTALNSHMIMALRGMGAWSDEREANLIDGGAPFYRTYRCSDGRFIAVGALESQFYAALLDGLDLEASEFGEQMDTSGWARMGERFAAVFATRTRDYWARVFSGSEACVTPVLTWEEALDDDHLGHRGTWTMHEGVQQASPAPRFSRTPGTISSACSPQVTPDVVLADWD